MKLLTSSLEKTRGISQNNQNKYSFKRAHKKTFSSIDQCLPPINPQSRANSSKVYESIINLNKNYLAEKVKVSEVKKPQVYQHKLPSKTGVSEYSRRYVADERSAISNSSAPEKNANSYLMKMPSSPITDFKTNYQAEYSLEKQCSLPQVLLRSPITSEEARYKDERPFYKESAYQRDYSFRGNVKTQPSKKNGNIEIGGKFNAQTTYKANYKNKNHLKTMPAQPILPVQNKLFVKVKTPETSNYQQTYSQKEISAQASFKPSKKYPHQFKTLQFKSEYRKAFQQKEKPKFSDFECLDEQKLLKYVLSVPKF